jgi:LmbE family N-acetylglucosaminyl deacetylase
MTETVKTRKKIPLFYIILITVLLLATGAVVGLNVYINGRLAEFEAAQPHHVAEAMFARYFTEPDFAALIAESGYVLREGESLENAVLYFSELAMQGNLDYYLAVSAFEEQEGAVVYIVRSGEVNVAKLTLLPSGETTAHGHPLYAEGDIMLIRRDRPEPPTTDLEPISYDLDDEELLPQLPLIEYNTVLQAQYSDFVVAALQEFVKHSRSVPNKPQVLPYYEPGSDIHAKVLATTPGYMAPDSYSFSDIIADEFLELEDGDGAFSCRVRFTFNFRLNGISEEDLVDYTLFLRSNAAGRYLIYDQYLTALIPEPEPIGPLPAELGAMTATRGGATLTQLTDGNYQSKVNLAAGETITMTAEAPARFVYLIWDRTPDAPTLVADGKQYAAGRHGFLHELLILDNATETIELTAGGDSVLADVYLLSSGILPDWVERWQPTLAQADLLVLPTHADDEHLFFGGILPTYAGEREMAVQVVYMTKNWVGTGRNHEALTGLWTVGVRNYPVLGPFNDLVASKDSLAAATEVYGHDEVLAFQVELLRRFKPMVVVGHDLRGEYGHGAHMLNALTLTEALELSSDPNVYPQSAAAYGLWDVPKAYLHLYAENQIVMDWTIPLARFDGRTAFDMAVEGYDKHVSQHIYSFAVQLGGTWHDCRKFGLYRSTVGPDIDKDDLFENLAVIER